MNQYTVIDALGGENTYDATDMRMALTLHEQIVGEEPVEIRKVN